MNTTVTFIQTPYKELPISNSMKRFFAVHEIPNLEKLQEITPKDLMGMKWFNARLLRELAVLMEANGVDYLE